MITEQNIVQVRNLSHRYSKSWAIQDINFSINRIGVVGLLGSNGAGKSTTMNIMCGVLSQTRGDVIIEGIDLKKEPEKAKRLIGFLPQNAPLHMDLTVDEYLIHCASIRLMPKDKIPAALDAAKARCGIGHFSRRLIRNLSGGYRQRVGIAQAIIHTPKLVVLDEPTNGLDPIQIYEVRNLIKEIASERSVIFSSHILSEVQATCQEVKMIEGGKMVFADTMDAFNNYLAPDSLLASFNNPPTVRALAGIEGITKVDAVGQGTFRLQFTGSPDIAVSIVNRSVQSHWHLREIKLERHSLDEVFARLAKRFNS